MYLRYSEFFDHVTKHAQFCEKSVDSKFPPVSNSFLDKIYVLNMAISMVLLTVGGMREYHLTVFF